MKTLVSIVVFSLMLLFTGVNVVATHAKAQSSFAETVNFLRGDQEPPDSCNFGYKCEGGNCNPDPVYTYTPPEGYTVCYAEIKAGQNLWTYTEAGCKGTAQYPDGYCVAAVESGVSAYRQCPEGPNCHAISHSEFWITAEPSVLTTQPGGVEPQDAPAAFYWIVGFSFLALLVILGVSYGVGFLYRRGQDGQDRL